MNPLCAKIIHSSITKYGTPLAPVTKYWTPFVPRSYPHSLRNMEYLLPLLLNMECLIWQGSYSHSLRNMEPLLPLLLNIERLMCQYHTPIYYKIWNPSCLRYYIWNPVCAKIIEPFISKYGTPHTQNKNSKPLFPNS